MRRPRTWCEYALLLLLSSCSFTLDVTNTKIKGSAVATEAGAVATTATKTEAPVASGTGNTATEVEKPKAPTAVGPQAVATDFRKAAQDGGALAAGAGAQASAVTKPAFPWWVLGVAAVVAALLGLNKWLRGRWLW
ncbi:hypothetical protein [Hymenobacter sp. B81]|uniref:hypothetical protein n=1 Tax=Hymenobacter sp. B81 TaxID=3344878 RepID=UPI0037DC9FA5